MAEASGQQLEHVGRYLLLDSFKAERRPVLGFDTQLDRRVLLHRISSDDAPTLERARRWSGASHPNLVAVHDFFSVEGLSYVVVEHVQGETLDRWLADRPRMWDEVRRALRGVARALETLHGASIVHGHLSSHAIIVDAAGNGHLGGSIVEVVPVDTDGQNEDVAMFAKIVASAVSSTMPRAVSDALASTRSSDPAGALARLAHALDRDPARAKRRNVVVAVAVSMAVMLLAGHTYLRRRLGGACTGAAPLAEQVWNIDRRDSITATFTAIDAPFAEHALERVLESLDQHVARWVTAHTDACEATRRHGVQSVEVLDRRMQCLDERREVLDTVIGVLEVANRDTVLRATRIVDALDPVESCGGEAIGASTTPPLAAIRATVDDLRRRLARVRAMHLAGEYRKGLEQIHTLVAAADDIGYAPLMAEIELLHGRLLLGTGEPIPAVPMLEAAVRSAWIGRHDAVAVQAWASLERVVGETLAQEAEGDEVWGHALAAWQRAGNEARAHAELLAARAVVMFARGKYEQSAALHRETIELLDALVDPDHPDAVSSLHNLANALYMSGDADRALRTYEKVLEIWNRTLGPSHPSVANVHNNMGAVHLLRGDIEEATRALERTLEIREAALGSDHLLVAAVLENLGVAAYRAARLDESERRLRASLVIKREKLPADSPGLAGPLINIGNVLHERGQHEAARKHYEQARALYEKSLGADHPNVGITLHNIGWTLRKQGDSAAALPVLERALALREKALGSDHPSVGATLAQVGQALIDVGRRVDGRAALERAEELWRAKPPPTGDDDVASARLAHARLLVSERGGRERALELANLALRGFHESAFSRENEAAAAAAFLRRHGG